MATTINLKSVLNTIETILKAKYEEDAPAVEEAIAGYLADAKETFKDIAEGVLAGQLSYKFVVARLKDEEVNIKDRLLSLGQIALSDLQDLANQAVTVFEAALKAAIAK